MLLAVESLDVQVAWGVVWCGVLSFFFFFFGFYFCFLFFPYVCDAAYQMRELFFCFVFCFLFFHFYCPVTWGWWVERSYRDNHQPPSSFSAIQSRYTCIMTVNTIPFWNPPLLRAVIGLSKCSRCQDLSKILAERQEKQKVSQSKQEQSENRLHRTPKSGEPQHEYKWFWNHESRLNIHESMWIQWQFLQKLEPKVIDP